MSLDAFISYIALEKNYSPHTVKAYARDIAEFMDYCGESHNLTEAREANYTIIRSWIIGLVERGISNRSINRKISSLKSFYKFLQRTGQVNNTPLAKHRALKSEKTIQVPFSEIEMSKVLRAIEYEPDFGGLRDRLIIELLYTTGIRRAELINLKRADIDIDRKLLKVVGKRNKERIVPLISTLVDSITAYLEKRNMQEHEVDQTYFLLTNNGHKLYETFVYRVINKYLSKVSSKVKKSPHMLRHTFATHLLNQGAELNTLKELLGHSSLASTQVYTHSSIAKLKEVHSAAHPRSKE
ncbi:MAG: tyrosine-type recombinase/integrase [Croceivirga sp.]